MTDVRCVRMLDALTQAGVWVDDRQGCRLTLERRYDRRRPRVGLRLRPIASPDLLDAMSAGGARLAKAARRAATPAASRARRRAA